MLQPTKLAGFRAHYGLDPSVPIIGPYTGGLNDFSERVRLRRPDIPKAGVAPMVLRDGLTYFDFDEWPTAADGGGPSLERIDALDVAGLPTNWAASSGIGTPGRANSALLRLPALSLTSRLLAVLVLGTGSLLAVRRQSSTRR